MSNKFKVAGYIEGFDVHEDEVRDYQEPPTEFKLAVLGILLAPLLFALGALLVTR